MRASMRALVSTACRVEDGRVENRGTKFFSLVEFHAFRPGEV